MSWPSDKLPLRCFYCPAGFQKLITLVEHLKCHVGWKFRTCQNCLSRRRSDKKGDKKSELGHHVCGDLNVKDFEVTQESLRRACKEAFDLGEDKFDEFYGLSRRKRTPSKRRTASAALGAPPTSFVPVKEGEPPESEESDHEGVAAVKPIAKRLRSATTLSMIPAEIPRKDVKLVAGAEGSADAVFEYRNTRFALLPSPTAFVNIGDKYLDYAEEEETYQDRFNMTQGDLALPSVEDNVIVVKALPYVEKVCVDGMDLYKIPALDRTTRSPVFLLAPVDIGNPGRVFSSCPTFAVMPHALLEDSCRWLTDRRPTRLNMGTRCIAWFP